MYAHCVIVHVTHNCEPSIDSMFTIVHGKHLGMNLLIL